MQIEHKYMYSKQVIREDLPKVIFEQRFKWSEKKKAITISRWGKTAKLWGIIILGLFKEQQKKPVWLNQSNTKNESTNYSALLEYN